MIFLLYSECWSEFLIVLYKFIQVQQELQYTPEEYQAAYIAQVTGAVSLTKIADPVEGKRDCTG